MRRVSIFIVFYLLSLPSFSQGLNNLWLLGYANPFPIPYGGTTIDFQSGQIAMSAQSRNINFNCANALISDSNGDLLFATNGIHVINATNDTMLNGSGLSPCYYTSFYKNKGLLISQGAIIIPFPNDSNKYYLFHGSVDDYGSTDCSLYLYFSLIDMSKDNGLGEVVQKNMQLLNDSLVIGRLTACKHANGRDWWLTCHKFHSTKYYKFLVTPFGIDGPFSQDIGEVREINNGQNCFSPDGSFFAYYEPIHGDLDIFNFDRCSGDYSLLSHVAINDGALAGGVAFSPNSKVLYVSSMEYIYQFDLTSINLSTDFDTVAIYDYFVSPTVPLAAAFFQSYLAPDGKIYINCGNATLDLHVINNPDSLGIGCNVCQHCIHLPTYNAYTIPNYPNYFLGSISGSLCDSLVGVSEFLSSKSQASIYPNPVEGGHFTILYPLISKPTELMVYNIQGQIVMIKLLPAWANSQNIKLPIDLKAGTYCARLLSEETQSILFIVN